MTSKLRFLIPIMIVAPLMFAGGLDYQDDVDAESRYCEMVKTGAWGAYNKEINCDINTQVK